jgi:hypothetical protein
MPERLRRRAAALLTLALAVPPALCNHGAPVVAGPQEIIVQGHYDNAIGTTDAASAGVVRRELIESRPVQRAGEVLEWVPGIIVTQHSGDGKANQYFLRGFNLDHGTDFATRIGGMPVNLPSHGHGQGYSDLNFLLPELVARMEYRKGPYYAAVGDFGAAGSADIRYLSKVAAPFGQITLGEDGYRRAVAGASGDLAPNISLIGAFEAMNSDGPWTVQQDLKKSNGVAILSGGTRALGWHATAMGYRSRWTATDQIPQRLIDAGTYQGRPFGRFDSLDSTTGGSTERVSLSGEWHRDVEAGRTSASAYAIGYRLDLNSNFTYALERPVDGDQFKQTDRRRVFGFDAEHVLGHDLGPIPARTSIGLQWRADRARVGLFDSVARVATTTVREDEVRQQTASAYAQSSLEFSERWRAVLGLRADHLRAEVDAQTLPANSGSTSATQLSPKLSIVHTLAQRTEVFLNAGRGLHSNDARGTTARVDPRSGAPLDPVPPLVAVKGSELGLRTEAIKGLQSSLTLWRLASDSELVYVGDAGTTEPSLASRRRGVEFNNRYVPAPWLLIDADFAWNHARFADGTRIPNAVDRVALVGLTLRKVAGFSASLNWRYLGSAALVEDNSVRSLPAGTMNFRLTRELLPKVALTLDVFNLADRKVNDIQYYYASQLPGEAAPVDDRHVHPAEPRRVRLTLQASF